MDESNVIKAAVFNSDAGRKFDLYLRRDRYRAFLDFLNCNRQPDVKPGMPGLSWAAIQGLDAIFEKRPRQFPVRDIIAFLASDCTPAVTSHEVEAALECFAAVFPPDVSESA
jgi:hypothetical protein